MAEADDEKGKKKRKEEKEEKSEKGTSSSNNGTENQSGSESSAEDSLEEAREKGKGIKWKKLCDQGAIPEHIIDMFNKEALKHKSPRQYRTKLINPLFSKDPKTGRYEMMPNQPFFENYKLATSTKYGDDKMKGQPRSVFLYSHFHGSEEGLNSAIQLGDVQCWQQNGTVYCGFHQTTAGTKKENIQGHKLSAGQVDVDQEQFKVLGKAFQKMAWSFDDGQQAGTGPSLVAKKEKAPKKLEEGMTPAMLAMAREAKQSVEKLLGSAMKIVGKAPSEESKGVKVVIMKLKEIITSLEHVLLFEARPLCFQFCFRFCFAFSSAGAAWASLCEQNRLPTVHDRANGTTDSNEKFEQAKAVLKARGHKL